MRSHFKHLTLVDKLFALLRVLVILGGISWMFLSPLSKGQQRALLFNLSFFSVYSICLYILIFSFPRKIRQIYVFALFLDLIFLFWLVKITGGFHSDFFLAFLLIIALHSFYFGMKFGMGVILLSTFVYLAAGAFAIDGNNYVPVGLRVAFFFLVGISMGLLSNKEAQDKQRIQKLNIELKEQSAELEQEKNKLAKILTGIDAGLILLNTKKEILWMNKVCERWFGDIDPHIGKKCSISLWKNRDLCRKCPTDECMKTGIIESTEIEEISSMTKKSHFFRITSAPLANENGKIDRILELFQDVTEERELQLHILQTSKLAAMGELASGVAHEINNPLGVISMCVQEISQTMRENPGSPHSIEMNIENIDAIKEEIQRCKRITTGLLDITPRTEHRRVPLDINQVIKNVRMLVRYKAEKEHKVINLSLSDHLPLIMGEMDTLSQVFLNLILNAIEFTPVGKRIEISSRKENEGYLAIHIKDEGCGIPPKNSDKIFKPFFTTKPHGSGSGLGLPISLRIVKNHGGEINFSSTENQGSIFTVLLPIQSEPAFV